MNKIKRWVYCNIFGADDIVELKANSQRSVFYITAWFTIIISFIMLTFGIYLYYFDGNPPADITNPTIRLSKELAYGDSVMLEFYACKHVSGTATVSMSFFNTDTHNVAGFSSVDIKILQKGQCDNFIMPVIVPYGLTPGTTVLRGTNSYNVNVLAVRDVEWESEPFEIILPEPE